MIMIQNNGEVDVKAFTLLGASVKNNDDSIGFFGSGSKYAIATLLRHGYSILVYSGLTPIEITSQGVNFRGEEFRQIFVNGEPTSLTTRTGPTWELWMAMRELICNAMDESGYLLDLAEPSGMEGLTRIFLPYELDLKNCYDNINSIVLTDTPLIETDYGSIHTGPGKIYRKGILCSPDSDAFKGLYNYNLKDVSINESRIYSSSYEVGSLIHHIIAAVYDPSIIAVYLRFFEADKAGWETVRSGWSGCKFSEEWHSVLMAEKRTFVSKSMSRVINPEDKQHYCILPDPLIEELKNQFPDLPLFGEENFVEDDPHPAQKRQVKMARDQLIEWGYPIPEVVYVRFNDIVTMAQYINGKIYISTEHNPLYMRTLLKLLYKEMQGDTTDNLVDHIISLRETENE